MPTTMIPSGAELQAEIERFPQRFESLLAKLAAARDHQAAWEASAARLRMQAEATLAPLFRQLAVYRRELITVLDEAYGNPALSDEERNIVGVALRRHAAEFLLKQNDSEVRRLYKRQSGRDYYEEVAQMQALAARTLREAAGLPPRRLIAPEDERGVQMQLDFVRSTVARTLAKLAPEQQGSWRDRMDVAYVNQDIAAMLALNIELDQLLQPGTAHLGIMLLVPMCSVLWEHFAELDIDTSTLQLALVKDLQLPGSVEVTECGARQYLREQQDVLADQVECIACDVMDFRDMAKLKGWLKEAQAMRGRRAVYQH